MDLKVKEVEMAENSPILFTQWIVFHAKESYSRMKSWKQPKWILTKQPNTLAKILKSGDISQHTYKRCRIACKTSSNHAQKNLLVLGFNLHPTQKKKYIIIFWKHLVFYWLERQFS